MSRVLTLATLIVFVVACQDEKQRPFVDFAKPSAVVVFKNGVTWKQIYGFLENHLSAKVSTRGQDLRSGIRSLVKISVHEHDAYAIEFSASTSAAQRQAIADDLRSSPIVLGVYENIAPDAIVLPEARKAMDQ